jgi:hypothetical protein
LGYDPILRAIQKVYPAAKISEKFRPNRPVARIQQAQIAIEIIRRSFFTEAVAELGSDQNECQS